MVSAHTHTHIHTSLWPIFFNAAAMLIMMMTLSMTTMAHKPPPWKYITIYNNFSSRTILFPTHARHHHSKGIYQFIYGIYHHLNNINENDTFVCIKYLLNILRVQTIKWARQLPAIGAVESGHDAIMDRCERRLCKRIGIGWFALDDEHPDAEALMRIILYK